MTENKCDYCKRSIIDPESYRVRVRIPCINTKYWMDGIGRIVLCKTCYGAGSALNELKTYIMIRFADQLEYEVKKEKTDLYKNFKDYCVLKYDQDKVNSMINNIDLNLWIYLLKIIMAEICEGNTEKIIELMEIGMLTLDY